MDETRRAFLRAVVEAEDSSTRDRLKAAELLSRLDERTPLRTSADVHAEFQDHYLRDEGWEDRLERLVDLALEHLAPSHPRWVEQVELAAEQLVAKRAAEAHETMRNANRKRTKEHPRPEPEGPQEAAQEVSASTEQLDPHSPELLARQWPSRREGGLRNIGPHRALRRADLDC